MGFSMCSSVLQFRVLDQNSTLGRGLLAVTNSYSVHDAKVDSRATIASNRDLVICQRESSRLKFGFP